MPWSVVHIQIDIYAVSNYIYIFCKRQYMGWRRDGDFDHRWKSDLNYRKADMFEQMVHIDTFANQW